MGASHRGSLSAVTAPRGSSTVVATGTGQELKKRAGATRSDPPSLSPPPGSRRLRVPRQVASPLSCQLTLPTSNTSIYDHTEDCRGVSVVRKTENCVGIAHSDLIRRTGESVTPSNKKRLAFYSLKLGLYNGIMVLHQEK